MESAGISRDRLGGEATGISIKSRARKANGAVYYKGGAATSATEVLGCRHSSITRCLNAAERLLKDPWERRFVIHIRCPLNIRSALSLRNSQQSGRWVYRTVTKDLPYQLALIQRKMTNHTIRNF